MLHGAAWGLRGPLMQAMRADYFGRSAIGMILGLSFMIIVVGQVGGPIIPGIFADITGDYRLGFTIIALLAGLGSGFFVLAESRRPPPRRKRARSLRCSGAAAPGGVAGSSNEVCGVKRARPSFPSRTP